MDRRALAGVAPFALFFLSACGAPPPGLPAPPPPLVAELRSRVAILAHDSMRGRETGSPGARAAAAYLAGEAARLGLRPAGDAGSYYHRVPLVRRTTVANWQINRSGQPLEIPADEIVPMFGAPGLPASSRTTGQGPLVYGGFLQDPLLPAARELRPEDLDGSVLIVRGAAPGADPTTTPPRAVLNSALRPGSRASAVLFVAEGDTREAFQYAQQIARRGEVTVPGSRATADVPRFFLISGRAAERLIGSPLGAAREPRAGLGTFRYAIREQIATLEAFNVVAVLPGSDSLRRGQYVALAAHYDHLGVGPATAGDSVFNGADDNASGTAALLEIAERFAAAAPAERPARSLLFVWHAAEEDGLRGSEAFVARPTVSRDSLVALLNLDMVGRGHRDSLFVVGSRRLSGELAGVVDETNRRQARPLMLDYSLDAPDDPERIFCRSDHVSYARAGIPVAFFTSGLHADYHQPSDEMARLNFGKLAAVTRLVGDLAAALADRLERPRVDAAARGAPIGCS